ncbi:hypothetical protein WN944_014922 [Citrus x changshan-huyou]|uniref:Uncharacterized protein n=1 Tax=Citrus x changshan-huyou TaxID=2935761 RepID=A0AAP0QM09_9ROSI
MKHCKVQSREGRVFMETLLEDEIVSDRKKWSLIKFIILMVGLDILILQESKLWGTFLADVVIQMLGTDYARILRAIYAFAQVKVFSYHSCLDREGYI